MASIRTINPATAKELGTYELFEAVQIEERLQKADEAFLTWRTTSIQERSDHLSNVGSYLLENRQNLARIVTEEMGKPITEALAEIEKCALLCDYYVEHGSQFLEEQEVATDYRKSKIAYVPLGPILAVMPWNFPFWQVFRFAVPNLMAGNVALLKHASNVPASALAIAELFLECGLPEAVFQTLLISSEQTEAVLRDSRIQAVTLTGSNAAGEHVGRLAGELCKKSVMELGGSDAYVILADADLDHAAKVCAASRLINSGQSCIAAKRFIVVDSCRREFEDRMIAEMQKFEIGDPMDAAIRLGPLARADLRQQLDQQVQASIQAGAKCILGGKALDRPGYFYQASILTEVRPGMAAFDEELFGPVAAIVGAKDDIEAVQLANHSRFGLGAAIFTQDLAKGEFIATYELDAGTCAVNTMVKSDPRLPFGGIKASGFGRELAEAGMREFVNVKTVVVQ